MNNKAIEDGGIKCFNMLESNLDGCQDMNFGTREMEDIVREIMEDLKCFGTKYLKSDQSESISKGFSGSNCSWKCTTKSPPRLSPSPYSSFSYLALSSSVLMPSASPLDNAPAC